MQIPTSRESVSQHSSGQNSGQGQVSHSQLHSSRRNGCFATLKFFSLLLHVVQYILVGLVGLAESGIIIPGVIGITGRRKLFISALVYGKSDTFQQL